MRKNSKILIAGGAGFIGSAIASYLINAGYTKIFIFDNFLTGRKESLPHGCRIIKGDIKRKEDFAYLPKDINYVFHLAAVTSVEESFVRPRFYIENNVCGTINLLEWALKNKINKIAYASSGAIYGNVKEGTVMKESLMPNPNNIYGLTKLDAEYLVNMYRLNFDLDCVILRYFNVFGEKQDHLSPYASVIPKFAYLAMQGKDITVYGTGKQTRDFIHVEDVALATILAMEKGSGIYNVATGEQHSVNTIAQYVLENIRTRSRIVHLPPVFGDSMKDKGSNKRISGLGWKMRLAFKDRLKQTLSWYTENISV